MPRELAAIGQICKENNGFLIVDEIYLDLALTPPHQQESAQLHSVLANRNLQDTLIVINSFSKYFGMTGWRLGWSVVPNTMTPIVEKLAQNLFICPSTLSQKAALACFTPGALAQSEENKNTLSVRANIVFNAISTMGLSIDAYPDGAFYAYINISNTELSAIEFCDKLLDTHHVALTPGNDFGEHNASQYVRLSFATEESRLIEGLNRLAQFVASCRK